MGRKAWLRGFTAALALAVAASGALAAAAAEDIGVQGPSFSGASGSPSGSKPESKLWWNDGSWWASMWDAVTDDFHIFELTASGAWRDTGVTLDTRKNSRADTLWDGRKLYVASHTFSESPASGYRSRLYRFSYDAGARRYTRDSGFPVTINNWRTETLVIDKDTTGRLWATWVQSNTVYVTHTTSGDTSWATPFALPSSAGTVAADDISTLVAFDGRIGVLWSNQATSAFYFAEHVDGASPTSWSVTTALSGSGYADDHINLKVSRGTLYAAIKTSRTGSSDPLIMLLVRDPSTGAWRSHVVARVSDSHTRPIVVVDEAADRVRIFATGPQPPKTSGQAGGDIYEKSAPLGSISFATGHGTAVIRDASSPDMNNPTAAKTPATSSSGVAVLATDDTTRLYWHHRSGGSDESPSPTSEPTTSSEPSPTASTEPSPTAEPTPSPEHRFADAGDAYVKSSYPNRNYGGDTSLRIRSGDPEYRTYVRFEVAGLSGTVTSARLRLYVTDASPDGGSLYQVDPAWTEGAITWANAPALPSSAVTRAGSVAAGTWIELDVGNSITKDGTYAFALASASTNSALYSSGEGANPPVLVIETG